MDVMDVMDVATHSSLLYIHFASASVFAFAFAFAHLQDIRL